MPITLERLKEILDTNFSSPFLEENRVKTKFIAHTNEKTLQVNIGRRDVWINENGKVIATTTVENIMDITLEWIEISKPISIKSILKYQNQFIKNHACGSENIIDERAMGKDGVICMKCNKVIQW